MITEAQKAAIDKMTEAQLIKQISVTTGADKADIISYCDQRLVELARMDRNEAMVVETDMSDMGGE